MIGMLNRDDIAGMLGISREVLRKSVENRPDFPRPALRLSRKTVRWERDDVERWIQRHKQQVKA
jgi:predicted DNA-binding transcriptional regulator AlpA